VTVDVDLLKGAIYDVMDEWSSSPETVDDAIVEIVTALIAAPIEGAEGPTLRDRLRVVLQDS
jgi:hypothetical protein